MHCHSLPSFLTKKDLPKSITVQRQMYNVSLMERWRAEWVTSPRHGHTSKIDSGMPSQGYWKLVTELSQMQTSILTQFRKGHIPLQKYLHQIGKTSSPVCPACKQGGGINTPFFVQL